MISSSKEEIIIALNNLIADFNIEVFDCDILESFII